METQDKKVTGLKDITFEHRMDISPVVLVENYEDCFPKLVKVTTGYCGLNTADFTFSTEEVYLVTRVLTQDRVILKDSNDQHLSFPADHRLKFCTVVDGQVSDKSWTLQDILQIDEVFDVGKKVLLRPVAPPGRSIKFYMSPDKTVNLNLDDMKFIQSYEERYLVANPVVSGTVYSTACVIPLWMPIVLDVGNGIKQGTRNSFEQLMKKLTTISRNFDNQNIPGHKEIILFQEDLAEYQGMYDVLEPCNSEYCTLPATRQESQYYTALHTKQQKASDKAKKGGTLKSENSEQDQKKRKHSGIKNKLNQMFHRTNPSVDNLSQAHRRSQPNDYNTDRTAHTGQVSTDHTVASRQNSTDHTTDAVQEDDSNTYDEVTMFGRTRETDRRSLPPVPNETALPPPGPEKTPPTKAKKRSNPPSPGTAVSTKPENRPPVTAPKPTRHAPDTQRGGTVERTADGCEYESLKDIPKTVSYMTVDQVLDSLRHLNLGHHVDRFRREHIDGALLTDITQDDLLEFGFSKFEAKKLVKFVSGWRPS